MLLLPSDDFFILSSFSIQSFRYTDRESNGLNPDQDRHIAGPDLDLKCLQSVSADNKSCILYCKQRVNFLGDEFLKWNIPEHDLD